MVREEEKVTIHGVTADEVFDFVTNPDRMPEWVGAVVAATSEGDAGVGRIIRSTSSILGIKLDATQTITDFEPPVRLAYEGDKPFPTRFEYTIRPHSDVIELTIVGEVEPHGLPGGRFVVGPMIKNQIRNMARSIQKILETER